MPAPNGFPTGLALYFCRDSPSSDVPAPARSRAKPGQKKPGQAGPDLWPETAFGPAWDIGKPKPLAWAPALYPRNMT